MTVDDLDPYFPDNPVMLIHSSNHGAVLNTAAFRKVGYDGNTPTPPGGVILRKPETTVPAGLIMETAFLPIFVHMPQPSEQEMLDTLDAAQQIYARVGVTTCQEGPCTPSTGATSTRPISARIARTSKRGTQIGPDERIGIWDALRAITIEAAWQIREEDGKGTIEPGKVADLVILDANPLEADTDALLDISVVETLKQGRSVYRTA